MDDHEKLNTEKRFGLLYKSLADIGNGFVENTMKTTGFLIVVIGWLLSSGETRDFLASKTVIQHISLVVNAIIGVIHILTSIGLYTRSNTMCSLLSELNYVEPEYYSHHKISLPHLLTVLIMNTSLFALIFALVSIGPS